MRTRIFAVAAALTLSSLAVAGAFASQSGIKFASVHSSAVIDPCVTTVPTDTTTPQATPTDTTTPEATATDTATPDPAATDTTTPEPTATCSPSPTATDVPATETSTPAPTDTPSATDTPSVTDTPQPTATETPGATETVGPTETATPGTGECDDPDDDAQNDGGGVTASPTATASGTACQGELGEGCEHSHSGDTPASNFSGTPVPCTNPHNDKGSGAGQGDNQQKSHNSSKKGDSGDSSD